MRQTCDPKEIENMSGDIEIKTEIINPNYEKKKKKKNQEVEKYKDCDEISYLARQMREEEALSDEDKRKLYNLKIQLIHEVPPQHKVEIRSGTHVPNREEIKRFKAIVPLKKGYFLSSEDEIIVRNWKKFCKLHKWNKRKLGPFLCLKDNDAKKYTSRKAEIKKFVQFLANGLPNRTLYSVYHRFRNLYSANLHGRYTAEEDTMILNHIEHNPYLDEKRKFVDLAKVLNRNRASLWRRYRLLTKKRKIKDKDALS